MKKTRFTKEQMVAILREADEKAVPEVAKKHGVSAQTIYAWRQDRARISPGASSAVGPALRLEQGLDDVPLLVSQVHVRRYDAAGSTVYEIASNTTLSPSERHVPSEAVEH